MTNKKENTQRVLDNHGNITQNGDIFDFKGAKFVINFKPNLLIKKYSPKDLTYWQWIFLFSFRSMFFILLITSIVLFFYFINPKDLNSTIYGVFASFGLFFNLIFFLFSASLFWNKWYYSKKNIRRRKITSLFKKYKSFRNNLYLS